MRRKRDTCQKIGNGRSYGDMVINKHFLLKMGRCSAPFCNNSSEKGYKLKVFPRNIEQRNQWVKNMNVKYWTPTNNTRLCEVHFPKDMWEKRADGKSKLKPNAVPIIFGHWITEKTISKKTEELPMEFSIENEELVTVIKNEQDELPSTSFIQNEVQPSSILSIQNEQDELPSTSSVQKTQFATRQIKFNQHHDIEKAQKIIEKMQKMIVNRDKSLYKLKKKLQWHNARKDKYKEALQMLFHEDQIELLISNNKNIYKWSNDTIQKALRLKFTCGVAGYEEICKQKIPLPSLRTLRRR